MWKVIIWHKDFGYLRTLQNERKTRVGITTTNLHYCTNKVNLLGLQYLTISNNLRYEGYALKKSFEIIRSHLVRGFHTYKKVRTLLGDLLRSIKPTLLRDLP